MQVTTKELRIQPGKIIEQVVQGQEVTVTFRGKALARIVPISQTHEENDTRLFGLWKSHGEAESVEEVVKNLRKGRQF